MLGLLSPRKSQAQAAAIAVLLSLTPAALAWSPALTKKVDGWPLIDDGFAQRFALADRVVDKLRDIKAASLNYYTQKMQWPNALTDIVTDGFYMGRFSTPYNSNITGAASASGNIYTLTFTAESETVAKHIANKVNGTVNDKVVTVSLALPAQSAAVGTTLNRFYDTTGTLNTMQTNLLMAGNDISNVGSVGAQTLSASQGVFDGGNRVYSADFKPTPAAIGAVPQTRQINGHALSADITLTKADVGLGNVGNYGLSDAYNLNSATTYASAKAVSDLGLTKLGIGAKAADSHLFDGINSTSFARTDLPTLFNQTVYAGNGLHIAGDWLRIDGNNGMYWQNWGGGWYMQDSAWMRTWGDKGIYSGLGVIRADGGFQVDGKWITSADGNTLFENNVPLNAKYLGIGNKAADTTLFDGKTSSDFVPGIRTINGKALTANVTLTKADTGLSNVANYGLSDAYTLNSTTNYASSAAVFGLKSYVDNGYTPNRRTINGKALSVNITLTKTDIGLSNVANYAISDVFTLNSTTTYASAAAVSGLKSYVDNGFTPTTRTINGKALSANITLTKADVGLSNVENYAISDAYTLNSTTTYASAAAVSGLKSYVDNGFTPNTRTINGKALTGDIQLTATDVNAIGANTPTAVTANTHWQDGYAASWGAGNDLRLYHDGNNSVISNATNDLFIDNAANGRETYLRSNNSSGTTQTAIGVISDTEVYAQLYHSSAPKLATTATGINVSGSVQSTDWQTTHMKADHSGNSFYLRPEDDGVWQTTREFGYDANTNRWFVETDLAVGGNVAVTGNVTASDVTAAGTSMSAIKSFMDNNAGSGGVESLFEGFAKLVNLSKSLEVGGVYYIQTAGVSGTDTCRSSLLEDNQFTVFTFTGIGQSTTVWGLCGAYTTAETMTVTASNQLTMTTGYSYDLVIRKVIRIN